MLSQYECYFEGENCFKLFLVSYSVCNNFDSNIVQIFDQVVFILLGNLFGKMFFLGSVFDDDLKVGIYCNSFVVVCEVVFIVFVVIMECFKFMVCGIQIVLVIGLLDVVVIIDCNYCVKVQFYWQCGKLFNLGGLCEIGNFDDKDGNVFGNDVFGIWICVVEVQFGFNWGSQFMLCIGSEVLIDFIEGDIDCLVVVV